MATKHKLDSKDPHYKEGRRMALELKHEHILAEAKRAADERKRVRDPPHTSKRDSVGCGKPRGRRGGRRHASATATYPTFECSLSSSVEVPFTATSTKLNPQEEFAIPPTTCIIKGEDGYCTHEQACILPTVKMPDCSCGGTNFTVLPGKPVILITINGRFDLHQPLYECQTCQQQWTPDFKDLLRSGYWPASVTNSTLYTLDLLSSLQELKIIAPGFSRQAFAKLLEHRTKCGGRL
ncbi:uncharacterized protein LOC122135780 [Cyprinus carpio]|uniref:Uncharacterized protein LOC122135780 n=1 Tax=Cyprinus carpio TaxID=7962 RepID=A0A9Q9VVH2_CYPCA|nr:uncharacterized protein LOC122135780 [Cyprinus carpio]